MVTVGVLLFGVVATGALLSSMRHTRESIHHLIDEIGPPKDDLLAAERATERGQTAAAAAVAASGAERNQFLAESISASQDAAASWNRYRGAALDLPGEDALARRYVEDQAASATASTDALVPILTSTQIGSLPQAEIAAHQAVMHDLEALHTLYRQADRRALEQFGRDAARAELVTVVTALNLLAIGTVAAVIALRKARRTVADRSEQREGLRLAAFESRLRRALELVDAEQAAFAVTERGVREMLPGVEVSLMVADSSNAMLTPVSQVPVCGVSTPQECPALRSTSTVTISSSASLDACPTLVANCSTECSTRCVAVSVAGRAAAVLQLVSTPGHMPDAHGVAELAARGVGERVTLLHALATFQLQAARDPLTGLLNRRSLDAAVEQVLVTDEPFAVAFCDLDHFKLLNDVHGHDAGDRALRSFARTLTTSLRPEDIICRWGGEEFVIVLPGCDSTTAVDAMNRARENLAALSSHGSQPAFTASFGVAESRDDSAFSDVLERADAALHVAKDTGRDQVVRDDAPALDASSATPVEGDPLRR